MNRTNAELRKIKKVLEFAWDNPYSSFYKEKYKKAGIKSIRNIKTWDDFDKLPFLTREEIIEAGPHNFFFLPEEKINEIGITSGTTQKDYPLVLLHSITPPKILKIRHQRYFDLKIKSNMMLLSVFPGQLRFRLQDFLWDYGIKTYWGDINNLELSAKIAARLEIDAIQTTPTILYYFTEYLKKGYDLQKIKLIYLAGEFCSKQKEQFFKTLYKNSYIEYGYGGTETRGRGYRCKYMKNLSPSFFHILSDSYYYELIDSHGQNELVLTSLIKEGAPVIRYKTGDAARLYPKKCKCGEEVQMEVFGRLEFDALKIQGSFIYSELISKAISPFTQYLSSDEWKLHAFEEKVNGKIMPRLKLQLLASRENVKNAKVKKLIQAGISKNLFVSAKLTLFDLVERGVFLPLEVEFLKEFPMELKRKRIISHLS